MAQVVNMATPVYAGVKTAKLINPATDAVTANATTVTRATNGAWYAIAFSGVAVGLYVCQLYEDGVVVAVLNVYIDAANGVWGDTNSDLLKVPRASSELAPGQFKQVSPTKDVLVTFQGP